MSLFCNDLFLIEEIKYKKLFTDESDLLRFFSFDYLHLIIEDINNVNLTKAYN